MEEMLTDEEVEGRLGPVSLAALKLLRQHPEGLDVKQIRAMIDVGRDQGLPCPPFSVAGKQLGDRDERNLFADAMDVIDVVRPRAVMIENVRGFLDPAFDQFRDRVLGELRNHGYTVDLKLLNACDFGVPQLRPRVVIVGVRNGLADAFEWPKPSTKAAVSVGEVLYDLMSEDGWVGANDWKERANRVAPTIVGGSLKHGGPDLGPTRARRAWAELGVNGHTIAECPPSKDFCGMPRLTVRMVARLQGFPDSWQFAGRKTVAYRQVGNAFPPPVARAVAEKIAAALVRKPVALVA